MFIQPITSIKTLEELSSGINNTASLGAENQIPFKSYFEDAVQNLKDASNEKKDELYKVVTGETDDLHNLIIASTKSSVALDAVIQIRNKALDAYNEIMRMGV